MDTALGVLLVVLWVAFVFIPAVVARQKGYSFWWFAVFGAITWFVALIVASVLPDRGEGVNVGQVVRTRGVVELNDGGRIPKGHLSKVAAVDIIDGHTVVQVEAPDGSPRWIAKSGVLPA